MNLNSHPNSREYQEKRDFIRMRVDSPVDLKIHGQKQVIRGICRDLSGGGMLVQVDTALPVGARVEVTLASVHGHAPMLRATAAVIRVCAQPGSEAQPSVMGLRLKQILV